MQNKSQVLTTKLFIESFLYPFTRKYNKNTRKYNRDAKGRFKSKKHLKSSEQLKLKKEFIKFSINGVEQKPLIVIRKS